LKRASTYSDALAHPPATAQGYLFAVNRLVTGHGFATVAPVPPYLSWCLPQISRPIPWCLPQISRSILCSAGVRAFRPARVATRHESTSSDSRTVSGGADVAIRQWFSSSSRRRGWRCHAARYFWLYGCAKGPDGLLAGRRIRYDELISPHVWTRARAGQRATRTAIIPGNL